MKLSLLMVTESITDRSAKISAALRSLGCSVSVVTIRNKNGIELTEFFDFFKYAKNQLEALEIISRHPCPEILYFPVGQLELAVPVVQSKKPFVTDYKDVIEHTHKASGELTNTLRYLLENAAGLIHRDFQADIHRRALGYRLPEKAIFFPDFCWPKESFGEIKKTPELGIKSVVFVGNYPSEVTHPDRSNMGLMYTVEYLLDRDFRVGYFPFPHGAFTVDTYLALQRKTGGRFTVHNPVHPLELHRAIQAYAWGGVVHQYRVFPEHFSKCWFDDSHLHASGGARLWEYVSAGVPLLYMNDRLNRRLLRGEYAGLFFNKASIDLICKMDAVSYSRKKAAIETLRNKTTISNYVDRLLKFLLNI
jgi:hypothetical protein